MQGPVPDHQAIASLRLFAQACLGVGVGTLIAVAMARLFLPPDGTPTLDGLLPWNEHRVYAKPREKGFYLLMLVLGGVCGYFATFRVIVGQGIGFAFWAVSLFSIPIGNEIIGNTLAFSSFSPAIPIVIAVVGAATLAVLMVARGRTPATVLAPPGTIEKSATERPWRFLLILLAMTLILIPSTFAAVAAKIGLNDHPVWFLFGPALYFLGDNLLPGIDYYTQYSIGMPWLFHFILGKSPERAVLNYTIVVILATWLFYAHLFHLLHWLYRSWVAATVVAFVPLILGFAYPIVLPVHFFGPSSSVLRYPLLTVCAVLTGWWAVAPRDPIRLLALAAAAAIAVFLETESGIIMVLTAPVVLFLVYPWRWSIALPVVGFLVATVAMVLLILFLVFGPGALQATFFRRLLDGMLYYGGSGYGGAPMIWNLFEWHWLYNLVGPGVSLATIGVIARTCGNVEVDRRRAAVLGFLAVSGLFLLVKVANQSLASVWQMSAIGPLSVIGWWCVALLRRIDPKILQRRFVLGLGRETANGPTWRPLFRLTGTLRRDVATAMIVVAVVFLFTCTERRNPSRNGIQAWATYPSLLKRIFSRPQGCTQLACITPNFPADSDIALIQSLTRPGEQVAIIVDLYDWTYLIKAHRPPLMYFLPSGIMFSHQQFEESLRRLPTQQTIFISKAPDGTPFNQYPVSPEFKVAVEPMLATTFQKVGESDRLVAYKRVAQ